MGIRAARGAVAALLVCAAAPADAAGLLADRAAWEKLTVPGEPAARFGFAGPGTRVRADDAVAFLFRRVVGVCSPCRRLAWRWRVTSEFAASDQAAKGRDDRAIAVHLWFDTGDADKTLRGDLARLWGYPRVTHAVTYVWGGERGRETWLDNPYYRRGELVVLRGDGAPRDRWLRERRDLAADIRRAFGGAVKLADLSGIAVSGDTDDTGRRGAARIAGLRLTGSPGGS